MEETGGLPLPLGGNTVRRDHGDLIPFISKLLQDSIRYGLEYPSPGAPYNGQRIGKHLADEILKQQAGSSLRNLHVVGVSVGAFAADECVTKVAASSDARIRLTLLDPFTARGVLGLARPQSAASLHVAGSQPQSGGMQRAADMEAREMAKSKIESAREMQAGVLASTVEQMVDKQLEAAEEMEQDYEAIRKKRIEQMRKQQQAREEGRRNGHGVLKDVTDQKEFFQINL